MRNLHFVKYQGTGNDFVCIDNRLENTQLTIDEIQFLCSRKFGIGSDGLILIEKHDTLDFTMIFHNPDGSQSFCGNGSRCAVLFAHHLGIIEQKAHFLSTDGPHKATLNTTSSHHEVALDMHDVDRWQEEKGDYVLDTGSPHYLVFADQVNDIDLIKDAQKIRYSPMYTEQGINVNFVHITAKNSIDMRTYERGVEAETLSCGTGVTAAALGSIIAQNSTIGEYTVFVKTKGGQLSVKAEYDDGFKNIKLIGPAKRVFDGQISLPEKA
jgi:diaminopimelate epimerase